MKAVQPASGQVLRDYPEHGPDDIERALTQAVGAFHRWRERSFEERAAILSKVADGLRRGRSSHARLITEEMGKPIRQSDAEIEKCAWVCEHFAEHARDYLANHLIATDGTSSYVRCDPLGVLLAIMPWNFPYWQVFRAAAPALMAGNVVVLKHASNVPGCALAIERCFRDAGLPEGGFTSLLIRAPVAEALVAHQAISAVTLTGSEGAGIAVARRAASRSRSVCSSSVAPTRSSCSPTPTRRGQPRTR